MDVETSIILVIAVAALLLFSRATRRKRRGRSRSPGPGSVSPTTGNVLRFPDRTAPAPTSRPVLEGRARVVDGDTVVIQSTSIRLFGIDAPELDHPYGKSAKFALIGLCKGRQVRAVVQGTDAHGRTVAQCFLDDGRDLSAEMVRAGLAIDWPKFSGGRYKALEVVGVRKKLWLADARQKGQMDVWERFAAPQQRHRPHDPASVVDPSTGHPPPPH